MTTKRAPRLSAGWRSVSRPPDHPDTDPAPAHRIYFLFLCGRKPLIESRISYPVAYPFRTQLLSGKRLVGTIHAVDNREWPLPDFVVNSADIFTENAHAEKWEAAHQEDDREQAICHRIGIGGQSYDSQHSCREEPQPCKHEAQPQRLVAEAGDRVHRILYAAQKAELAFAADAVPAIVLNDRGAISDPRS